MKEKGLVVLNQLRVTLRKAMFPLGEGKKAVVGTVVLP